MSEEIQNVKITSAYLGVEDHGIFTSYVQTEGERNQGFGGYDLRHADAAFKWCAGVMRVLGADNWTQVVGKFGRIKRDGHQITALGHIVEDRWFYPATMYD